MNDLTTAIEMWAVDRKLDEAQPEKQMLKLQEEVGELAAGLARGNQDQVIDAIGDVYVVLTILSMQLHLDVRDCVNHAYYQIKDRKGEMRDGVFVKEEDLHD
nr:MazG-like family protein [Gracilibacillus lacisalsi]